MNMKVSTPGMNTATPNSPSSRQVVHVVMIPFIAIGTLNTWLSSFLPNLKFRDHPQRVWIVVRVPGEFDYASNQGSKYNDSSLNITKGVKWRRRCGQVGRWGEAGPNWPRALSAARRAVGSRYCARRHAPAHPPHT